MQTKTLLTLSTFFILIGSLFLWSTPTNAAVDLVTVPSRESVQLTVYNSADITMIRETRVLTFKRGLNRLQFSWAGTLIDPTSLRLSFKSKGGELDLLDTVYPPGRKDALRWNINSRMEGPAKIELNYFTSGITWRADYTALTNSRENSMNFKGNVRVINNSGEDYPNAKVRLVVGHINLVEKIKDLAKGKHYRELAPASRARVRDDFRRRMRKAEKARDTSELEKNRKSIVKEGLSEYFLFTIEGRESIPHGWQKELNSIYVENVPVQVVYRLSDVSTRGQVHKFYEFKNKKVKGKKGVGQLGDSPLPDGMVRIFSLDPNTNLRFRGAVHTKYVARGDKVKLNIGLNQDVRVKRVTMDYRRNAITVDTRYNKTKYVKNYREISSYETLIENTLSYPIRLEIERRFPGEFVIKDLKLKWERVNQHVLKYYPDLQARSRQTLRYKIDVFRGSR